MNCVLFLLALSAASAVAQDSCNSEGGGGLVGFTALTPDQLREEISTAIGNNLSEFVKTVEEREAEEREAETEAILSILGVMLEGVNDSVSEVRREMRALQTNLRSFIASTFEEAVQNLTLAFREELTRAGTSLPPSQTPPPPPSPSPPPPTQAPTTTVTTPTAPPPTTAAPTAPPLPPGLSPSQPATSCQQVQQILLGAPSGRYWIVDSSDGTPTSVYCDMSRTCGSLTGGWMRMAHVNMSNHTHQCPGGFVERNRDGRRTCVADSSEEGCFPHTFPLPAGPPYTHVCGRILAYQDGTPNAFFAYQVDRQLGIDGTYVDGISLTHGSSPRSHVWTFVAALDETLGHLSACECSNSGATETAAVPPFVGGHYFCDTGSRGSVDFLFYGADPLWDGSGCGPQSSCCSFNGPPWFYRQLATPTSDGLEMRVCRDSGVVNEDIPFEVVELYVR